MKRTLIIGASNNPERYAYKAAERLLAHGHEIELLGLPPDTIFERPTCVFPKPTAGFIWSFGKGQKP